MTVVNMLDCNIICNTRIHFQTNTLGKGMDSLIPLAISSIIPLLSFNKDGFDIKSLMKVDMPLKQINQTN